MPTDEPVYTPEDVAALLKVSPRTVLRMVAAGELYGFKVRKQVRIPVDAYRAYVRGETYTPGSAADDTPTGD